MKKPCLLIGALVLTFTCFGQFKNPKRGLAFGYHSEADFQAISGSLSWWYNWASTPEPGVSGILEKHDMEFVPMAWNASYNASKLREFYASHPEAKFLLGFNEPNFREQANMTPSAAAAAWPGLEAIADEFGLELVSPAVNWCGNCVSEGGVSYTNPYDYLDAFFEACPDCRVDYIAVHNYMCYAGPLIEYLEGFRKYGRKLWLTEFACWDQPNITLDMQKNLVIGALDYLDNDSMIYRYSWFTGRSGSGTPHIDLFESEAGKLSELGELYVHYNPVHDTTLYVPVPDRFEAENYACMSGIALEGTSDFDGIANVGWIDANDWLEYNLNVADSGTYFLYLRLASTASTSIRVLVNGSPETVVNLNSTGGWQNWKTFKSQVGLDSGKVKLRLHTPEGSFNINWLRISRQDNSTPLCSAGEDQEIISPENSTLLLGQGSDPDGDSLIFKWSQLSGATCTIESPDQEATFISGLSPGYYYFRMEVFDGYELVSDMVRIAVKENTVGMSNPLSNKLEAYPNPANDLLIIKLPESTCPGKLSITNVMGQQVFSRDFSNQEELTELDISDLETGIYFIKLGSSKGAYVTRVIKSQNE